LTFPSRNTNHPFGRDTFSRREDAERFIEELRKVEPEFASSLRSEEHELEAGGLDLATEEGSTF
jgi:predicted enzyme related to lactoylglutathione lyase